jgi:hypothetical protein
MLQASEDHFREIVVVPVGPDVEPLDSEAPKCLLQPVHKCQFETSIQLPVAKERREEPNPSDAPAPLVREIRESNRDDLIRRNDRA